MVATTWEQVRAAWAQIAPWMIPLSAGTADAASDTTQLTDIEAWQDPSSVGISSKSLNNRWIFRPDAAAAGDRKRRIGGNSGSGLVPSTGAIYPMVAWTNAPDGEQYDIFDKIDPEVAFNLLVQSAEQFWIPDYSPLSMFTDSDMQTSGTTNYSLSGAGSLSKVTTANKVNVGAQALFFNAGTAAEYIEGPSVRVMPGESYFASVLIHADAGGPFAFVIWDKTNDAELGNSDRVYTTLERYVSLQRKFTTTAHVVSSTGAVTTQGTEEVALRVYCTAATDDAYISAFSGPYKTTDARINAPSTLQNDLRLRKLLYADYGLQYATGVYDADSRDFTEIQRDLYHVRAAHHHANPYRIEFRTQLEQRELWIEHLRRLSDVVTLAWTAAGETSPTIPIEKRLIALDSMRRICKHLLTTLPTDTEIRATLSEIDDPRGEYKSLMLDYQRTLETPQYRQPARFRSVARL